MIHITGYIGAIILSAIMLIFINGEIGRVLVYTISIAVVISFVLVMISRKHFTVKLEGMSGVCECGSIVEFEVTLEKSGFCFIPYVMVCVETEHKINLKTALLFRKSVTVKGYFRAEHSGLNTLTMKNVVIGDFLGSFLRKLSYEQTAHMAVLPMIVDYDGPEVFPNTLPSEEEEVEEGITVMHGGMPGYEHREYVEGDSPRRVNYKLSAKKGKLMVRLDESSGSATTNLFIGNSALPVCCDKAFALATKLVMRGGTVKITHKGESRTAATPETLDRLREWLAFREYACPADAPILESPPADTAVIFKGNGEIIIIPPGVG